MADGETGRVGTMRDWPGKVIWAALALIALGLVLRGNTGALLLLAAVPVLAFGGVALLIRRGAFTPRR